MKLISTSLTKDQIRASVGRVQRGEPPIKDVTRRLGWLNLKPGERLQVCEKCMGRRHGEPLVRICIIEVVSVRREPLRAMIDDLAYGRDEVRREGFHRISDFGAEMRRFTSKPEDVPNPHQFIWFFIHTHKGCDFADHPITRIEFKYIV